MYKNGNRFQVATYLKPVVTEFLQNEKEKDVSLSAHISELLTAYVMAVLEEQNMKNGVVEELKVEDF